MTRSGYELGVELGRVFEAGYKDLPAVADDYNAAWLKTPVAPSVSTTRPDFGHDPGPKFDAMCDKLNKALSSTEDALRDTGRALVWVANKYAETDSEAEQEFNNKKKELGAIK